MPDDYLPFIVGALSGLLTGLAALASYYVANRQNRLSATSVAGDWLRDLRAWASEAVDVLAEAAYCCPKTLSALSESEKIVVVRCRHRLSALIDRGRFLLPNELETDHGEFKSGAYKGFRHSALDALVAAERILGEDIELFSFPTAKSALLGVRREFVSIVQGILDPRSMNKSVAAILRHAQEDRKRDPSLGGLLPDPGRVPEGDEGLLYTASRRFEESRRL
ncbi:MAG: hypothetical protein Q8K29_01325 [Polaromonas sp.]|nr:hypothetical protein [Polaromonas sp.]